MNDKRASGGLGFGSILFLIFLVLKLVGVINWSWWWVTAPLWVPLVIVIVGFGVLGGMIWWRVKKGGGLL